MEVTYVLLSKSRIISEVKKHKSVTNKKTTKNENIFNFDKSCQKRIVTLHFEKKNIYFLEKYSIKGK